MSLAITTPLGTIVHTGDWKLDPAPEIGPMTDEARFRAIGDAGVLALICNSTNAMRDGKSPSEQDVGVGFRGVIQKAPGRVCHYNVLVECRDEYAQSPRRPEIAAGGCWCSVAG